MIFITGDTHGEMDLFKLSTDSFPEGTLLGPEDYVIICGDFGVLWRSKPDRQEKYLIDWLTKTKSWTTLFVDGNHENHTRLDNLPLVDMFGSKVGKVNDRIYHLKRGEVYNIDNKKIFTMGGALSVDKENRLVDISWWDREIPSWSEFEKGFDNLEKHNNEVDYIIGHTGPKSILDIYFASYNSGGWSLSTSNDQTIQNASLRINDAVANYFDEIVLKTKFKKMFFGHIHDDWKLGKFQLLYYKIMPLK